MIGLFLVVMTVAIISLLIQLAIYGPKLFNTKHR